LRRTNTHFVIARIVTGFGIGADLAIVNTFIGEMAPRRSRAKSRPSSS
jgi:putative MFS transporter